MGRATEYWTTVIDSSSTDREDSVKRMREDFKRVPRFEKHRVQRLQKIGEGGQGEIYRARVYVHNNHLNEDEQIPVNCVVKEFKHGAYGQWPEAVFELSKLFPNICKFLGYHIEGETKFYLIMHEYDCSLRGAIDKQMVMRKGKFNFWVAFAFFYFSFAFYVLTIPASVMSILALLMPRSWCFVLVHVILRGLLLLGCVGVMRAVFVSFLSYFNGSPPLADDITLFMMIHIALGMWILHENPTWRSPKEGSDLKKKKKSLVHRDLKADNVFVKCKGSQGFPIAAYIGDFDVGSKVVGTRFWRAPEILQALQDKISIEKIEFGIEADVYSYAMKCYEILTGGIPLQELMHTDYDAVISGKSRPKLPSNLNPKMRALIERCWHSDPAMRPTFCDIITELEELVKELVTGSQDMSNIFANMFANAKTSLDIVSTGAELNVVKLKELLQELVVKYNQADFLLLGLELVAAMEEFKFEFGFESFKKQPGLPYSEWFARRKLHDTILWKRATFALKAAYIAELGKLSALMENIIDTINKDNCPVDSFCADDDGKDAAEIARRDEEWGAYLQDIKKQLQNDVPSPQHKRCVDKLTGRVSQDDEFQVCALCKFERGAGDEGNVKYMLYVGNGESPFTKLATLVGVKIGRWNGYIHESTQLDKR